jgi:hypothetical protein
MDFTIYISFAISSLILAMILTEELTGDSLTPLIFKPSNYLLLILISYIACFISIVFAIHEIVQIITIWLR